MTHDHELFSGKRFGVNNGTGKKKREREDEDKESIA
jgi:hypothetical protein